MRVAGTAVVGGDRRREHDRRSVAHDRDDLARREVGTAEVEARHRIERLRVRVDDRRGGHVAAGVDEQDVDRTAPLAQCLDEPVEVGEVGRVRSHAGDVWAEGGHGLVDLALATCRDDDVGTLGDEPLRDGSPDPCRSRGHHGELVLQ